jgi:hypothetical protein
MKMLIIMVTLVTSLTSFTASANEVSSKVTMLPIASILGPFISSYYAGLTTSGKECDVMVCKEANQVVQDTLGYLQNGELSVYLNQKIKDIQSLDSSLSEVEALEILVSRSVEILK